MEVSSIAGHRQSPSAGATRRRRRTDAVRNEEAVRVAARAVFLRLGDALTMDDVADEAGVSKGTVYATFPGRDTLVRDLTVEALEESSAAYREANGTEEPWQALAENFLNPTLAVPTSARLLDPGATDSAEHRAHEESLRALGELLEVLKTRGIVRPEVTVTQVVTLFRGLFTVPRPDPDRAIEERRSVAAIILRGIRV
jgi:AcrR family transcriptional regulator